MLRKWRYLPITRYGFAHDAASSCSQFRNLLVLGFLTVTVHSSQDSHRSTSTFSRVALDTPHRQSSPWNNHHSVTQLRDSPRATRLPSYVSSTRPAPFTYLLLLLQLPGHSADYSEATFCLMEEDHTLGNALRWMIMKKYVATVPCSHAHPVADHASYSADVEFCGYRFVPSPLAFRS